MTRKEALERLDDIRAKRMPGKIGFRHERRPDGSETVTEISDDESEAVIYERA